MAKRNKVFIITKVVSAKNIMDALEKEKKTDVDSIRERDAGTNIFGFKKS